MHIVFYTEGLPFDGETPEREGLGGSESALVYVARALVGVGHRVQVFCRCPRPGEYAGVRYRDLADFGRFGAAGRCEVLVVSRFAGALAAPVRSELGVLWNHDVLTEEGAGTLQRLLWKTDYLFVLSQFQREQYRQRLPEADRALWVTRNGVDLASVRAAGGGRRDRYRLLYTSRPERGLERLLDLWPKLREAEPRLTLGIAHYLHPEADRRMADLYGRLREHAARLEGVELLGALPKGELYRQMQEAGALVYPTHFPETSCISALEAAACGLPVVASRYCALTETVADGVTGILVPGDPDAARFRQRFADSLLCLLADEQRWQAMSRQAAERAQGSDWRQVAEEWSELFTNRLQAYPAAARARHLVEQGETAAAARLAPQVVRESEPTPQPLPEPAWPWLERRLAQEQVASLLLAGPGAQLSRDRLEQVRPGLRLVTVEAAERPGAALVAGLLESADDPGAALAGVEQAIAPDGLVLLALGCGPEPARRRGFDGEELTGTLGGKPSFACDYLELEHTPRGERRGLLLASYRADGRPASWPGADTSLCRPRQTLSVCMIVRDGARSLRRCLESVRPVADEILVYDTGSRDDSLEVAGRWADRVERIPWPDDFSQARNQSIAEAAGDWILWLDADECLVGAEHLGKYLRDNAYQGYVVRQHHCTVDARLGPDFPVRLFRNGRGIRFYGAIHEHPETGLNEGVEPCVVLTDVHLMHDGYLSEAVRRERFRRNLPLLVRDRERYPERRIGLVFLARDYLHLARYELEEHGRLTGQARGYLEKVVAIHRGHFLDPEAPFHQHAQPLYEQALELLGAGLEAACFLAVGKELPELGQVEPMRQRFWCREDLGRFLERRVEEACRRLFPEPEFPFEEDKDELRDG